MAKSKKVTKKTPVAKQEESSNFFERIQTDVQQNNSILNMVLGGLIVIVLGILVYNYFNRPDSNLGPSQQTANEELEDVDKNNLPGKYTVKEGDTLFIIAEKYYDDGNKFSEIQKENNITDANSVVVGQVLTIPKIEAEIAEASPTPSPAIMASPELQGEGTGGAENQTIWGERIASDTYTVQAGDWLSTISGRAYGDILAYEKIAQANNIQNPDLIEPGTVLKIPR